jgi:hypothetical protein
MSVEKVSSLRTGVVLLVVAVSVENVSVPSLSHVVVVVSDLSSSGNATVVAFLRPTESGSAVRADAVSSALGGEGFASKLLLDLESVVKKLLAPSLTWWTLMFPTSAVLSDVVGRKLGLKLIILSVELIKASSKTKLLSVSVWGRVAVVMSPLCENTLNVGP